jgi:hypothetical protein
VGNSQDRGGGVLEMGRTGARHSGVVSERTQMVLLTRYQDGAEVVLNRPALVSNYTR